MAEYRLLNYAGAAGEARPGISVGDLVVDLQEALNTRAENLAFSPASTLTVLDDWDAAEPVLEKLAAKLESGDIHGRPLSDVQLLAPLLYPNTIFNAASNYYEHSDEMAGKKDSLDKTKTRPYFFLKSPRHVVINPGDEIRIPHITEKLDWEAELGVVIGREGRNLTVDNALSIVAGYTIFNDLSARDQGIREDRPNFKSDWFAHKNFEGAGPLGPWMVPAKQIADPYEMKIDLWVNDTHMQDAVAGGMIFNIEEQIEYLSARMTLRPGDVIATGTPAGVGRPQGIFLKPGDTVRITIGGIGEMSNPVVAGE